MKNIYAVIARFAIALTGFSFFCTQASAITYTAVVSGNFNNTLTWGGVLPSNMVTGDVIIIPNGVTVTMDNTVTMSGSSSLIVNGTLNSSTNPTALILSGGSLSGTGAVQVNTISIGPGSGFTFTGTVTADAMTTWMNVTSSANLAIAGTLQISNGTLNIGNGGLSMLANATVIIDGGAFVVSGTGAVSWCGDYNVIYQGSPVTTGVELTGSHLANVTINLSNGGVTLASDLDLNGMLTFNSGDLDLNGHNLAFDVNGNIQTTGSGHIISSTASSISINSAGGLTGALNFGTGMGQVKDLTVNLGDPNAVVTLNSDLLIDGLLSLNSGSLRLAGNDLVLAANSDIAQGGTGTIMANTASDVSIMSNNYLSGVLRFNTLGNTVHNFIMNMPNVTGSVKLGSALNVQGMLVLGSGLLNVNGNELTVETNGGVSGGSQSSYVVVDNGGIMTQSVLPGIIMSFPVGTSINYIPAIVTGNSGCGTGEISMGVANNVLSNGYGGGDISLSTPLVDATWYMTGNVMGSLDVDVELMWDAALEVNGFNSMSAYVSQHNGINWDATTPSAVTNNSGMHSLKRNNVSTLSPMMVTDNTSTLAVSGPAGSKKEVVLYPNPATDVIRFDTDKKITDVAVYDIAGRKMPEMKGAGNSIDISNLAPGYYSLQLVGENSTISGSFIKSN